MIVGNVGVLNKEREVMTKGSRRLATPRRDRWRLRGEEKESNLSDAECSKAQWSDLVPAVANIFRGQGLPSF